MENNDSNRSCLLFYVKESLYMIPVEHIASISAVPQRLVQVPRSPPYVLGVYSILGESIPVIDLHRLIEGGPVASWEELRYQSVIVLDRKIALLVGRIVGVEPMEDLLLAQRSDLCSKLVRNIYRPSSKMWDYRQLKSENELALELNLDQLSQKCRAPQPIEDQAREAVYGRR